MKRRNREIAKLDDLAKRRCTKCKRGKQLMKKARELSVLCGLDINISIFDPTLKTFVEFASDSTFTVNNLVSKIHKLTKDSNKKQYKLITPDNFMDNSGKFNQKVFKSFDYPFLSDKSFDDTLSQQIKDIEYETHSNTLP